jgi:hypothetical protein
VLRSGGERARCTEIATAAFGTLRRYPSVKSIITNPLSAKAPASSSKRSHADINSAFCLRQCWSWPQLTGELIDVCIYIHASSRIGLTASYLSIRRRSLAQWKGTQLAYRHLLGQSRR